jgi:ubiquinone/menaquinone biosynthesis C-methylase UbiE
LLPLRLAPQPDGIMDRECVPSEALVQRVNELYHDLTKDKYDYLHPEIFEKETQRWEISANRFLNTVRPLTLVDVGTGTGFVPLILARFLKRKDVFICSDISPGILNVARLRIEKQRLPCDFKFVRIEKNVPLRLPFESESADVVTINSVLHHVKNTEDFLGEVERILKPDGVLIIGHEPNRYFRECRTLWWNYLLILTFLKPYYLLTEIGLDEQKSTLLRLAERFVCFMNPERKVKVLEREKITAAINNVLLEEQLIKNRLTYREVTRVIDVKDRKGFAPDSLLPSFRVLHLETYNHISWISVSYSRNVIVKKYDRFLRRTYPMKGSTFFAVMGKT